MTSKRKKRAMAYSDIEKAETIIKLAINKYDFRKTEEDTGIPSRTIKRWLKASPKKDVAALLDRAIERMLMVIPDKWNGRDWAIALGILIDKWLLLQGEPTARSESIIRGWQELTDEQRNEVINEANRILSEAIGGRVDTGDGKGGPVPD